MTDDTGDETKKEERDIEYTGTSVNNNDWDQDIDDNHDKVIDRRQVDAMTSALAVVEKASERDMSRYRSEVCDEQHEQIDEAVDAALAAADAVRPTDDGVPHLNNGD